MRGLMTTRRYSYTRSNTRYTISLQQPTELLSGKKFYIAHSPPTLPYESCTFMPRTRYNFACVTHTRRILVRRVVKQHETRYIVLEHGAYYTPGRYRIVASGITLVERSVSYYRTHSSMNRADKFVYTFVYRERFD